MDECPKCRKWTFYYDPKTETKKCLNCGFEKNVKYEDFIKEKNTINHLFYPSKLKQFFIFTSSSGQPIGETILYIEEFPEKIKKIDTKTIEFHFYRGDFEKWIADIFRNKDLAEAIRSLREKHLKGESLRNELYNTFMSFLKKAR